MVGHDTEAFLEGSFVIGSGESLIKIVSDR